MGVLKNLKVANAFNDVINFLTVLLTVVRVISVLFFIVQTIFVIKKEKGLA